MSYTKDKEQSANSPTNNFRNNAESYFQMQASPILPRKSSNTFDQEKRNFNKSNRVGADKNYNRPNEANIRPVW